MFSMPWDLGPYSISQFRSKLRSFGLHLRYFDVNLGHFQSVFNYFSVKKLGLTYVFIKYIRPKKKLLAFSFANFKITRWSTGKQWSSLEYPTNLLKVNYTGQNIFSPIFEPTCAICTVGSYALLSVCLSVRTTSGLDQKSD